MSVAMTEVIAEDASHFAKEFPGLARKIASLL